MIKNRLIIIAVFILPLVFQQCKVTSLLTEDKVEIKSGIPGYSDLCSQSDSLKSITISKVDALINFQGDRYETTVTIYHYFDSIIYLSAVSSGFEMFRGTIDKDTIKVIDRINKIVYFSPMRKKFGYQHPVNFKNLEILTNNYGCCKIIEKAYEYSDEYILFDISEEFIRKKIYLNRNDFHISKFEFFNTRSNNYFIGEKNDGAGFNFHSNFLIDELEIEANGGEITFNREISVKMNVNRKKYTFIELQ